MKFATKLVVGTTMIITALFSIGGSIMIKKNFEVYYEQTVERNIRQHILCRYSLESGIRNRMEQNEELMEDMVTQCMEKLTSYGTKSEFMGIVWNDQLVCSNYVDGLVDQQVEEYYNGKTEQYLIKQIGSNVYMYLATSIQLSNQTIKIMNVYDLSSVFQERTRQNEFYLKWFFILLGTSVAMIVLFSKILTSPIKRLNESSKRIANGSYNERTGIHNSDEIGELSTSFDVMAKAVEEHIDTLEQDIKNRETFISDFSHELKTPMTAMMGYSKLLLKGDCNEALQKKSANYIYSECKRLEALSRRLLQLMEIEEQPIELVSISTTWLEEKMQLVLQPFLENERLQLESNWEPCFILGDVHLLLDYLKNIVENGIKASKEKPVIHICGKRKNKIYQLSISDEGCGMSEENLKNVKKPFYMADKSRARSQGSSGLGLSICERIAALHHSGLEITSTLGKGTTVTIYLEVENEEDHIE